MWVSCSIWSSDVECTYFIPAPLKHTRICIVLNHCSWHSHLLLISYSNLLWHQHGWLTILCWFPWDSRLHSQCKNRSVWILLWKPTRACSPFKQSFGCCYLKPAEGPHKWDTWIRCLKKSHWTLFKTLMIVYDASSSVCKVSVWASKHKWQLIYPLFSITWSWYHFLGKSPYYFEQLKPLERTCHEMAKTYYWLIQFLKF